MARINRLVVLSLLACASAWLVELWSSSKVLAVLAFFGTLSVYSAVLALQCASLWWVNRHEPVLQATVAQLARAWWVETLAAARVFFWWQPFRVAAYPDQVDPRDDSTPARGIVLVHGFVCNRALWSNWFPVLQARGIPFSAVNLEPVFSSIDNYAALIEQAVGRLHRTTGLPPLVVAHSMGGLAVRAWLRSSGADDRVHWVITIGSPHNGTKLGGDILHLSEDVNAGQMRHGSDWLAALGRQESPARRQKFTCFYSNCDNIVMPSTTAILEGADNRFVAGIPHVALALDHSIMDQTLSML